jgi:hypothetical protein
MPDSLWAFLVEFFNQDRKLPADVPQQTCINAISRLSRTLRCALIPRF